jgi:hypothetical protein
MDSVPSSQAALNVNEFPTNDKFMWYGGPDNTLIGGSPNGVSPWMQKFLGDFAPTTRASILGLAAKGGLTFIGGTKAPTHLSAVQAVTLGPMIKPEDAGGQEDMTPEEAKKKKKLYVALGLGAVLAVGVGVWATRRRKR